MAQILSLDPGFGNIKLYGPKGGLVMPSTVSIGGAEQPGRMVGLRTSHPPLRIQTEAVDLYVGENSHEWGRPVENLDFDRLAGSPEMGALFHGALTRYGIPEGPINLIVGLPIATLMGEGAQGTQQAVRGFLQGPHRWSADGQAYAVMIESVLITSQPVGAMFDYLLSDDGAMTIAKQAAFHGEIGILSIGMNTVESLVVRNGAPVQRFTAGETLGVRRLLELTGQRSHYSLAELDAQLREGRLELDNVLPVWQSEVFGFLERCWGSSHQRFGCVVVVGGGARLLREPLLRRFKSKAYIPDDPIIATARGLYKYTLMRARKGR
jgi:hypothetical protein